MFSRLRHDAALTGALLLCALALTTAFATSASGASVANVVGGAGRGQLLKDSPASGSPGGGRVEFIAGATVQLLGEGGRVLAHTVSGTDGKFTFTEIPAGSYRFRVVGWHASTPSTLSVHVLDGPCTESCWPVYFLMPDSNIAWITKP